MSDYEHMRQKYASLEAQYFALVKAIADGLALQAPPRYVVSKDFTMPVEVAGSLEPGAMQMLVPSESVQFPLALPIDMVLHCPKCHLQHIDAPESPKRTAAANSLAAMWGVYGATPHIAATCAAVAATSGARPTCAPTGSLRSRRLARTTVRSLPQHPRSTSAPQTATGTTSARMARTASVNANGAAKLRHQCKTTGVAGYMPVTFSAGATSVNADCRQRATTDMLVDILFNN